MNKKPLVIYHAPCADGFAAAYCAWLKFGYEGAEYVPGSYTLRGDLPDVADREVYILDFSYSADVMRQIAAQANEVIILDHHKSAEAALLPLLQEGVIRGQFDMNRSGAGMAWDYFNPGQPRIQFIDYVEDRDLWRFKLPDSKEINQAVFSYEYTFEDYHSMALNVEGLRKDGHAILRNHLKNVREIIQQHTYLTIQGVTVPAINTNYIFGSDAANMLSEGQPFAAYYWTNKEGRLVFGLRSKDEPQGMDVSEIARKFPGGGGHKHASGFTVDGLEDL